MHVGLLPHRTTQKKNTQKVAEDNNQIDERKSNLNWETLAETLCAASSSICEKVPTEEDWTLNLKFRVQVFQDENCLLVGPYSFFR